MESHLAVPQYATEPRPLQVTHAPVSLGAPAAGAAVVYTAPSAVQVQILSACVKLVTSSQAASRVPRLVFLDQAGVSFGAYPIGYTIAASKTSRISFGVGVDSTGANDGTYIACAIPPLWLLAGCQVKLDVDAIDTADQLSEVRLYVAQRDVTPLVPLDDAA